MSQHNSNVGLTFAVTETVFNCANVGKHINITVSAIVGLHVIINDVRNAVCDNVCATCTVIMHGGISWSVSDIRVYGRSFAD